MDMIEVYLDSDTMKPNNENGTCTSESTSHKVIIDPTIPIENLLGSVTTYNNVDGSESLQLRTSARVFKKMKLDSALASLSEKKEQEKKEEIKCEAKKPFPKPFWSAEDKNYFFEALNEYGKDFEAIHTYVNVKLKKKGAPDTALKSREQIRHLYYRSWHKISKHLKFSPEIKKVAQELYGLINYGEIRKKLTSVSEKTCIKLNELIYRGTIAIRVKGRTIRVKTPMCKVLRRLNRLQETDEDIKLPTRVLVECVPRDMNTWMKVQAISQNPRICTLVPLQRRLSSLIYYLSDRWKSFESIEMEKLLLHHDYAKSEPESIEDKMDMKREPSLRLMPPKDSTIVIPNYNITEFYTTHSICLNAYEKRIGVKQPGEALWLATYPNLKQVNKSSTNKRGIKRTRTESSIEKSSSPNNNQGGAAILTDNNENCVTESELNLSNVDLYIDQAVNTILALQQQQQDQDVLDTTTEERVEGNDEDCEILPKKDHDINNIHLGWTLDDCGTITIGDLYLMFGNDNKIILEYGWDDIITNDAVKMNGEETVKVEKDENEKEQKESIPNSSSNNSGVSKALQQLLSVAKLHYRKNMVKCPCGHVCNSKNQKNKPVKQNNLIAKLTNDNKLLDVQTPPTMLTVIQPNNIPTTAKMVPIIIQPEIKKYSPQTIFRRPSSPNCGLRAQLNSIQRMVPRYCNRKGRPRTKQPVLDRKLPLLAKKVDPPRMGQITIIPHETTFTHTVPATSNLLVFDNTSVAVFSQANIDLNTTGECAELSTIKFVQPEPQVTIAPDILDNATTLSRVSSPTSISNLLDMALESDTVNVNANQDEPRVATFEGMLEDNTEESFRCSSPTSPSRLLKENENLWINSEVGDFSFSSFLGHLESPIKTPQPTTLPPSDDTRMSLTQDMDAQLQSLLTESSTDYTAKFADLAAQVNDTKKE